MHLVLSYRSKSFVLIEMNFKALRHGNRFVSQNINFVFLLTYFAGKQMKKKQVNAGEILRSNYFQFPSGNPYLTMSATTKNT